MVDLFQKIDFVSHSGIPMKWKIECDAISLMEWECIAHMIKETEQQPWRKAIGIPRGGVTLGLCLDKFSTGVETHPILIADDVYTTGRSFKDFVNENYPNDATIQWCVFARQPTTGRVKALFTMPERGRKGTNWSQFNEN